MLAKRMVARGRFISLQPCADIDAERSEEEEASSAAVSLLGPTLSKLWTYSCALTKGRNVSCMAWNKLNPVSKTQQLEPTIYMQNSPLWK